MAVSVMLIERLAENLGQSPDALVGVWRSLGSENPEADASND
ncbi:MAG: hypothetical protein ACRDY6_00575 [Acidimicrobiia bacterium]